VSAKVLTSSRSISQALTIALTIELYSTVVLGVLRRFKRSMGGRTDLCGAQCLLPYHESVRWLEQSAVVLQLHRVPGAGAHHCDLVRCALHRGTLDRRRCAGQGPCDRQVAQAVTDFYSIYERSLSLARTILLDSILLYVLG